MAGWIKSLRQQDGSFVIVIPREVYGKDGKAAIIEDFATRATPLEFANAILRAHGVEPAHVFSAALAVPDRAAITRSLGAEPHPNTVPDPKYVHHEAVMAEHEQPVAAALREWAESHDDDLGAPGEPPRCKTGGCEG